MPLSRAIGLLSVDQALPLSLPLLLLALAGAWNIVRTARRPAPSLNPASGSWLPAALMAA